MSNRQFIAVGRGRDMRLALLCAMLAGLSAVGLLALSGWFLTAAAMAGATSIAAVQAFNYLIPSATIRALAILRTGARYGERLLSHRAALTAMAGLRARLFATLAAQDSRHAPDLAGGDASARLIDDISALEDLIVRQPTRPASLTAALFAVGITALAGWRSALALAIALAILPWLLNRTAAHWTRAPARAAAQALGDLKTAFVDHAAARAEIIAYGLVDRVSAELADHAARLDTARAALFRGEGAVGGLLALYGTVATALVLLLATSPAALVALALLAASAAVEAMAAFARTALKQASVEEGLARLDQLLSMQGTPQPATREQARAMTVGIDAELLAPGERVAIIGPSGSGKTQLLTALAGLRRAVHPLFLAQTPLNACAAATLTGQFALAPQDASLIAGTLADNLRLARPGVTASAMQAALHVACLDARIATMADGVDSPIGESGGTLSGGERKRLSLARAILAERPWLLLDEPTEGLDAATEAQVIERLRGWLDATGTGLILVSHRPAPLTLADRQIDIATLVRQAGSNPTDRP